MAKIYRMIDYYLKGVNADCYRYVVGELKDINGYHEKAVLDKDKFMHDFCLTEVQYQYFYQAAYWDYERINRYLLKHQRRPLFDTSDLVSCINKRKELLAFLKEEECMKKYNLPSFDSYVAEVYVNDLTSVIDLYANNKWIMKALQIEMIDKNSLVAGLADRNIFKYINWTLIYIGLKPLFDNPDDLEKCMLKRNELLKLMPKDECLKYLGIQSEEELKDFKIKRKVFALEKLISCYGEDPSGTSIRYYVGYDICRILDINSTLEQKREYINKINRLCNFALFEKTDNIDECIAFLKEKFKLVDAE